MSNNTYNGWTNYATWRVNLEMFDGNSCGLEGCDAQAFRDIAEEIITEQSSGLALDYAMAFLSEVNWYEIASHYTEQEE